MNSNSIVLIALTVLLNGTALLAAAADRSWGALAIAIFVVPGLNLALGVGSTVIAATQRERDPLTFVTSVVVPVFACMLSFGAIGLMNLHGC